MPKASTFGALIASQVIDSDSIPLITNAGDNKRLPISEARQAIGPGWSSTINAYNETGISRELKIQAAITHASNIGASWVFIPSSMLPYDPSLVTFNSSVLMVREGGAFDVYDAWAYGVAAGNIGDQTAAINNLINNIVPARATCVFPAGTYAHDGLVNVTRSNIKLVLTGAIFSHSGVASSVAFQVGAGVFGDTFNVVIQDGAVDGTGSTSYAWRYLGCGRSVFNNPTCLGAATRCFSMEGTVLCELNNPRASANDSNMLPRAFRGLVVDKFPTGGQQAATANIIKAPIIEGLNTGISAYGIEFIDAQYNTIYGGTSEGNDYGFSLTSGAISNLIIGLSMEATNPPSVTCAGSHNRFLQCAIPSIEFTTGAYNNALLYGNYDTITIDAGVLSTVLDGFNYTNPIVDNGAQTERRNLWNATNSSYDVDAISQGLSLPGAGQKLIMSGAGTNNAYLQVISNGGQAFFGLENSGGGSAISGASAYSTCVGSRNNTQLHLVSNNVAYWTVKQAGELVSSTAASKIIGGATSLSLRNAADSADNVLVTDAGVVTARSKLNTAASTSSLASYNVPPGTAPTSPVDGDLWTTTVGSFKRVNGKTLFEVGALVSADRGDTAQTLTVGTDEPTQRWATTLTANRVVTLSSTGALNGSRFRVVRTGLGAFTLDVGGLKTIPSATAAWVDVEYDGGAWRLTGYGTL